ncbi:valine--tRNA ligase [Natribacillus halophilus]|uniref:Valine--tRNA ligase n=1 Tax=Natribacillus halophilus TaxID=549003 RepID=A0A1G8LTD2_9BACI|nr:valine--tRNA ligase [Natribacillus halophilus]SDI58450.1 valyl-tRNA synthetase [Natribacillus halophilus]
MSEMASKYVPQKTEAKWYPFWVNNGYFEATEQGERKGEPFSIVIPPPNVTGRLHLGHAWDVTLQDIIARQKRMEGYDMLWLPGMDHAGIATQAKVEAQLKEKGQDRHELGRENFLEVSWDWKEEYANFIRDQWATLGLSLDYTRERFTLDDSLSDAVREVFVRLYEKGLIYRGQYIINWDPETQTALSDIEVEYKEVEGSFYHMKYPLKSGDGHIEVATTRPETMLGDTAVAVHPEDERYQSLIGETVILPIVGREMPIVADEYVDREFGSGAVKITPAHDPNDFEMGERHGLSRVLVMDEAGVMNENAGDYQGLDRFECRERIVRDLQTADTLFHTETHTHSVGHSERSGAVVEPYLSTQWFVDMKPLAQAAIDVQTKADEKIHFVPSRFEHTYLQWLENIRDWCISRQLWWGHRIPAWYHKETGEIHVGKEAPADSENWEQDEDVLDTWFSSALWPFSTMGWPDTEAEDFQYFYPTNVLVTGYDIIFFWVSRMIFQGLEFTDQRPFRDVLIHGLVRDAEGRKMSKSLGNGVDPMDVVEKYGADALRFTLATGTSPGNDLTFQWEKVTANWNFGNKIWNAARFAIMNMEGFTYEDIDLSDVTLTADRWILTKLKHTVSHVTRMLDRYEFGEAGKTLYNFIWEDVCDWYIEMAKLPLYGEKEKDKQTARSVLAHVLDETMRLLHPFMPFLTEEIWQYLPHTGETITRAPWPQVDEARIDEEALQDMELYQAVIRTVRNTRAEMDVSPRKDIPLYLKPTATEANERLTRGRRYLEYFCQTETLAISTELEAPDQAVSHVLSGLELYIPLAGLIDIRAELKRLQAEKEKMDAEVERLDKKLANEGFVNNAPDHVVQEERTKHGDYTERRRKIIERMSELEKMG